MSFVYPRHGWGPVEPCCIALLQPCHSRQVSLQKAQEQKAQDEGSREESLHRAPAVISPFTSATVHRQIGALQIHVCNYSSAEHAVQASSSQHIPSPPLQSLSDRQGTEL